jgi:hypothetical protein
LLPEFPGRDRDELVDQIGELGDLTVEVVQHAVAHVRRHLRMPPEYRQVGLEAGERRAEFVPRILHEALLFGSRHGERPEHVAERRAEAADLVVAGPGDVDVEATRRPDLLCCSCQTADRRSDRAGDQPTEESGCDRHDRHEQQRAAAEVLEHALDLVERPRDLHGAITQSDRVHPQVPAIDADRRTVEHPGVTDDGERTSTDADIVGEGRRDDRTVCGEDPDRVDLEQPSGGQADAAVGGPADHLLRRLGDRAVDLVEQADTGGAVADQSHRRRRDQRDGRQRQCDLPAQPHQPSSRAV